MSTTCPHSWQRVYANNEAANSAEQVLSAAEFYLGYFDAALPAQCSTYQNGDGCTRFAWDEEPNMVVTVRWHTCCEEHPIVIESVEFMGK